MRLELKKERKLMNWLINLELRWNLKMIRDLSVNIFWLFIGSADDLVWGWVWGSGSLTGEIFKAHFL